MSNFIAWITDVFPIVVMAVIVLTIPVTRYVGYHLFDLKHGRRRIGHIWRAVSDSLVFFPLLIPCGGLVLIVLVAVEALMKLMGVPLLSMSSIPPWIVVWVISVLGVGVFFAGSYAGEDDLPFWQAYVEVTVINFATFAHLYMGCFLLHEFIN